MQTHTNPHTSTHASPNHVTPNHHAGQGGFSGPAGLLAGLTMAFGREGDGRWAIELTGAAPGDRVVDIGCGPGQAVKHAAEQGLRVIGVDPAAQMLRLARRLGRGRRAELLEGTAESLPIGDATADVIWSIASVHHWTDVDAGLREVRRGLVPGGRLAAIERSNVAGATGHASHGWTDDQAAAFADLCRQHGFADVRVAHATVGRRRRLVAVVATIPE